MGSTPWGWLNDLNNIAFLQANIYVERLKKEIWPNRSKRRLDAETLQKEVGGPQVVCQGAKHELHC